MVPAIQVQWLKVPSSKSIFGGQVCAVAHLTKKNKKIFTKIIKQRVKCYNFKWLKIRKKTPAFRKQLPVIL
jgi:hypothetical protein